MKEKLRLLLPGLLALLLSSHGLADMLDDQNYVLSYGQNNRLGLGATPDYFTSNLSYRPPFRAEPSLVGGDDDYDFNIRINPNLISFGEEYDASAQEVDPYADMFASYQLNLGDNTVNISQPSIFPISKENGFSWNALDEEQRSTYFDESWDNLYQDWEQKSTNELTRISNDFNNGYNSCMNQRQDVCRGSVMSDIGQYSYFMKKRVRQGMGRINECIQGSKEACANTAFDQLDGMEQLTDTHKAILDGLLDPYRNEDKSNLQIPGISKETLGEKQRELLSLIEGAKECYMDETYDDFDEFATIFGELGEAMYGKEDSMRQCDIILEQENKIFNENQLGPRMEGLGLRAFHEGVAIAGGAASIMKVAAARENMHGNRRKYNTQVVTKEYCSCMAQNRAKFKDDKDEPNYTGLKCDEIKGATQKFVSSEMAKLLDNSLAARADVFFTVMQDPSSLNGDQSADLMSCLPHENIDPSVLEGCSAENQGRIMSVFYNLVKKRMLKADSTLSEADFEQKMDQLLGFDKAADGASGGAAISDAERLGKFRAFMDKSFIVQNLVGLAPDMLGPEFANFNDLKPAERHALLQKFDMEAFYAQLKQREDPIETLRFNAEDMEVMKGLQNATYAKANDPDSIKNFYESLNEGQKRTFVKLNSLRHIRKSSVAIRSGNAFDGSLSDVLGIADFVRGEFQEIMVHSEDAQADHWDNMTSDRFNEILKEAKIGDLKKAKRSCGKVKESFMNICRTLQEVNPAVPEDHFVPGEIRKHEAALNQMMYTEALGPGDYKYEQFLCYNLLSQNEDDIARDASLSLFAAPDNERSCVYSPEEDFTTEKLFPGFDEHYDVVDEGHRLAQCRDYLSRDYPEVLSQLGTPEAILSECKNANGEEIGATVGNVGHIFENVWSDFLQTDVGVDEETAEIEGEGSSPIVSDLSGALEAAAEDVSAIREGRVPPSIVKSGGSGLFRGSFNGLRVGSGNGGSLLNNNTLDDPAAGGSGGLLANSSDADEAASESTVTPDSRIADKLASMNEGITKAVSGDSPMGQFHNNLNAAGANVTPGVVRTEAERALRAGDRAIDEIERSVESAKSGGADDDDPRVKALLAELEELRNQQSSLRDLLDDEKQQRILAEAKREEAEEARAVANAPVSAPRGSGAPSANGAVTSGGVVSGAAAVNANVSASGGGSSATAVSASPAAPSSAVNYESGDDSRAGFFSGNTIAPGSIGTLKLTASSAPVFQAGAVSDTNLVFWRQQIESSPNKYILVQTAQEGIYEKRSITADGKLISELVKVDPESKELLALGDVVTELGVGRAPASKRDVKVEGDEDPADADAVDRRNLFKKTLDSFFD